MHIEAAADHQVGGCCLLYMFETKSGPFPYLDPSSIRNPTRIPQDSRHRSGLRPNDLQQLQESFFVHKSPLPTSNKLFIPGPAAAPPDGEAFGLLSPSGAGTSRRRRRYPPGQSTPALLSVFHWAWPQPA